MKSIENVAQPLVSVIIPCYNSGATILRAVDSVLRQTYSNVEIIVVNDGSSDLQTIVRLKELETTGLKVISHDINQGLPSARNSGFIASVGTYVLFLDADDWFSETMIEKMIAKAPVDLGSFFIYTDIFFEGERHGPSKRIYRPFSQLVINKFPYALMFKKSSINWSPLYDEKYTSGLEDWDLNLRFLESGFTPIRVDIPLFHYHVSVQGMFAKETQRKFFSIWKQIRNSRCDLYTSRNLKQLIKTELKEFRVTTLFFPLILLFASKFPITRVLDNIFKFLQRRR